MRDPSPRAALDAAALRERGVRIAAIIPIYNGRRFLRGAVESVAAQTLLPSELYVVDDGSTDDSLAELDALQVPFPVIRLRQQNAGQSAARNYAARETRCEFIALLDCDDRWHPRHLERLAQALVGDPLAGWSHSNVDEIDEHGRLVRLRLWDHLPFPFPMTQLIEMLSWNMHMLPSGSLIRRDAYWAVGGFDERLSGYEDDDFFLRLFLHGYRYVYLPESLTDWRLWHGSSSHTSRMVRSEQIYAEKLIEMFRDQPGGTGAYVRQYIAPRFFTNALTRYREALHRGDWEACLAFHERMVRYAALMARDPKREARLLLMKRPRAYAALQGITARLPARVRPG